MRAPKSMDEIEAEVEREWKAMTRWYPWWRRLLLWLLGH